MAGDKMQRRIRLPNIRLPILKHRFATTEHKDHKEYFRQPRMDAN